MAASSSSRVSPSKMDTLKLLIASDIHLGYAEDDPELRDDSFNTFEEILQHAKRNDVDLILLGGNLFHYAKPSLNALNRCIQLLRTYVLGYKAIDFEFLSQHSINCKDESQFVSIPIFAIHGDRDDVNILDGLSAMNVLSSAGLLNYIGGSRDEGEVVIDPVIVQKNNTKLAIHPLGHVHEARLERLCRSRWIKFPTLDEKTFNLMMLHQKRAERTRNNYKLDDHLPAVDLIVWGHEQECLIEPQSYEGIKAKVSQPGSSVVTSLSKDNATEKHIGILEVCGKNFKLHPVKLKTVRPFVFRSYDIVDTVDVLKLDEGDVQKKLENFFSLKVNEMIEEARKRVSDHPNQPMLPLVHMQILFPDETHFINTMRFGQTFFGRIANPDTLLAFKKVRRDIQSHNINEGELRSAFEQKQQKDGIENFVDRHFNEITNNDEKLQLFDLDSLKKVYRLLMTNCDEPAAMHILNKHREKVVAFLGEKNCDENKIPEGISEFQTSKSNEVREEAIAGNPRNAQNPGTSQQ